MSLSPRHRLIHTVAAGLSLTASTVAAAQAAPDPRSARIDALEAQVRALAAEIKELRGRPATDGKAEPAIDTAIRQTTDARSADVSITNAATARNVPPSRSPDQTRPVTSSTPGPNQGLATFMGGHPSINSSDGRFVATLHAAMHFDAAAYLQPGAGSLDVDFRRGGAPADGSHARDLGSGTVLRRARIGVDGRVFGTFEYNVLFDFGGAGSEDAGHVFELWAQYSGLEPFHLRIGAFSPSMGLEDQNSVHGMPLLERPAIVDIARGIAAGDYREAVQLSAGRSRWFAAAALTTRTVGTVGTNAGGGGQSFDQNLGGTARFAAVPLKGADWLIHSGVHGSRVFSVADSGGPDAMPGARRHSVDLRERPELRVDGTRLIDTGAMEASHVNEIGLELAGQRRNIYLQGEYERIVVERRDRSTANPRFNGWYVEGGWVVTGERRKYNTGTFAFDAPTVDRPLGEPGGWGALEIVGRYSFADLDYRSGSPDSAPSVDGVRGGTQRIVTMGVNWYLNPILRLMLDYQHVRIERLSPNSITYATPVGAEVGQRYDAIALRSQFAF